eukprot:SM000001S04610  [mRNA]  locus=s1:1283279:1287697:+ [translate_table: standard]
MAVTGAADVCRSPSRTATAAATATATAAAAATATARAPRTPAGRGDDGAGDEPEGGGDESRARRRDKKRRRKGGSGDSNSGLEIRKERRRHRHRSHGKGGDGGHDERQKRRRRESDERPRKCRKEKRRRRRASAEAAAASPSSSEVTYASSGGEVTGAAPAASAVALVADLVAVFPAVSEDLRQLLRMVDDGQAVDVAGVEDAELRRRLQELFRALRLTESALGLFSLPPGAPATLEVLAPGLTAAVSTPPRGSEPAVQSSSGPVESVEDADMGNVGATQSEPRVSSIGPLMQPTDEAASEGQMSDAALLEAGQPSPRRDTPQQPAPPLEPESEQAGHSSPPRRRLVGPAMPPPEVLAAVARLTEAGEALRAAEAELEMEPLVGPPPPAAVAEAEDATEAERFEEVLRVSVPGLNAYDILGVQSNAAAAELKKRYWKLSLLVHPDKNAHPQAQAAFTLVNQAFKDLQDPIKRSAIDGQIADAQDRKDYEAELVARKEAAQWRKIRGELEAGDEELLSGAAEQGPVRGTWMTELPPERQACPKFLPSSYHPQSNWYLRRRRSAARPARQAQTNTFFSRKEVGERGDTSAWTDTPADKARKAKQFYLEAYNQTMLQGPSEGEQAALLEQRKATEVGEMLDAYNASARASSLVDKHQKERVREAIKEKKQQRKQKQESLGDGKEQHKAEAWEGKHPWKPWDREKDLVTGPAATKWTPNAMAQNLAAKFGSERRFL